VVDAPDDPRGVVSDAVAVLAGTLAMAAVFGLGAIAQPRPIRHPSPSPAATPARSGRWSVATALAIALLAGGVVALLGPVPVAVAVVSGCALRRRAGVAVARRRREEAESAMPDAIELLVLCVRAGCSPTQAVVELVARAPPPLRPAFAAVELQLHRGRALADALGALAEQAGPPGRELARTIAAADRNGLPLAPVLDRLVADARAARRRLGDAAARRLPVRLTFPLVTCTLPAFVLLTIAPAVLGAISTLRAHGP
jgi:Flp pilus assembly protein TadB